MRNKNTKNEKLAALYMRIGTDYYKIIEQPLTSGDRNEIIKVWRKQEIIDDHGRPFLSDIGKYDSFCFIPDHENYQRVVGNSYNKYEPIPHEPKEGEWQKIEVFLKHIFGEQYAIGLDYLTIIWKYPTQRLPILCLVSEERNTGKTTFLLFLKAIFGKNMTFNTNEDFRTHFNSGWTCKSIIGVDEVFLERKEDAEKLKNLSTSKTVNNEAKGKDRFEQEFFGKFILCSNNETDFLKIDSKEIRYWIRKVPTFQTEDKDLLDEMKKEIPAFIHFLTSREIETPNRTRMWFTREQLWTDALKKVIQSGTSPLEHEIKDVITDQFLNFEQDEVKLTQKDIIDLLKNENGVNNVRKKDITDILKKWGYEPTEQPKYYKKWRYVSDNEGKHIPMEFSNTGRYCTFKRSDFVSKK
jgi:hypothetical protein